MSIGNDRDGSAGEPDGDTIPHEDRDPLDIQIDMSTAIDPGLAQAEADAKPVLVHQHDEDADPLDAAIVELHEQEDDGAVIKRAGGPLNPPPADEYD